MHKIEADGEARAWLWAYSTLRANDVHEASRRTCSPDDPLAHTFIECGPPSEQTEVQAELEGLDEVAEHGEQIEELLDEREGGEWRQGHRLRLYLVKWRGYGVEHSTWQSAAQLVNGGGGSSRGRQLEIKTRVARLRKLPAHQRLEGALAKKQRAIERQYGVQLQAPLPDVLDFSLLPALQREFANNPGGWTALRTSSDLSGEAPRLHRALAVMERYTRT